MYIRLTDSLKTFLQIPRHLTVNGVQNITLRHLHS